MDDTSIPQRDIIRAMTTSREDAIDLRVCVCLRCVMDDGRVCLEEIDYCWMSAETHSN